MPFLHLESLPRRTSKGELLHFLITQGGIGRAQVGRIELQGTSATVEVPAGWEGRLVKALDGAALKARRVHVWEAGGSAAPASVEAHFRRPAQLLQLAAR